MDFEQAKAFLQKDLDNGSNLYDHLVDTISRILKEKPNNPYDSLEATSSMIKEARFVTSKDTTGALVDREPSTSSAVS
jgi:hypothetical protein